MAYHELSAHSLGTAASYIALAEQHGEEVPPDRRARFGLTLAIARLALARRRGDDSSVIAEVGVRASCPGDAPTARRCRGSSRPPRARRPRGAPRLMLLAAGSRSALTSAITDESSPRRRARASRAMARVEPETCPPVGRNLLAMLLRQRDVRRRRPERMGRELLVGHERRELGLASNIRR